MIPMLTSSATVDSAIMPRQAKPPNPKRKEISSQMLRALRRRRNSHSLDYKVIIIFKIILNGVNLMLGLASGDLLQRIRVPQGLLPAVLQRLYHSQKRGSLAE
jgi:hypothetical protein